MAEIIHLRDAVEGLHGCPATYRETIPVEETFQGAIVWTGDVYVFDLDGHDLADVAYAWSEPVPESNRHRYFAVLHAGPVKSAQDAVRASIIQDHKEAQR